MGFEIFNKIQVKRLFPVQIILRDWPDFALAVTITFPFNKEHKL